MSNIKQLLEKANRKCEMRWRVFAFDPAKDNELVHTSKEAFDCIKMAGEYKMDLAKKHPDYIIEIIAESKERRDGGSFTVNSVNFDDKYKKAYEEAKKLGINISPSYGYPIYNNKALIQAISKKFPEKTPHISIHPYEGYYAINVVANGSIWHNLDNKKFSTVKEASEYAKQRYSHPQYIDILVSNNQPALESVYKNEADKTFLKKIEDVLHRYNLPSAKIVDERKVDNTHYIYKIDVNLTDYAKSLQKDAIDFDKVKKDNALKALSFLTIDGIYPQRNSQSILMQVNFHKRKPESAQKNEEYKAGQLVGDKFTKDYVTILRIVKPNKEYAVEYPNGSRSILTKEELDSFNESAQKNEEKEFTIKLVTPFGKAKVCSWKANSADAAVKEFLDANPAYRENKKGAVIAESAQKNEATYDIHTLKMDPASNPYKALPFKFSAGDILKSRDGKRQMKVLRKAGTQYEVQINNEPKKIVEVTELRNFLAESLGDDIVREVKEEVKDGVKDLVQQDVDAKLNGEVTPADYQATYGEDIDDDSDSIFGDELDNVEPEQSIRR